MKPKLRVSTAHCKQDLNSFLEVDLHSCAFVPEHTLVPGRISPAYYTTVTCSLDGTSCCSD